MKRSIGAKVFVCIVICFKMGQPLISTCVFCLSHEHLRKKMTSSATTTRKEKGPRKQKMKKNKHVDSDSDEEDYASDVCTTVL